MFFFFFIYGWRPTSTSFSRKSKVEGAVLGSRPTKCVWLINKKRKKAFHSYFPPPLLGASNGLPPSTLCLCVCRIQCNFPFLEECCLLKGFYFFNSSSSLLLLCFNLFCSFVNWSRWITLLLVPLMAVLDTFTITYNLMHSFICIC